MMKYRAMKLIPVMFQVADALAVLATWPILGPRLCEAAASRFVTRITYCPLALE